MDKMNEILEEWISKLKDSDKLIIVEGKRDRAALEELGIKNVIILKNAIYKDIENVVNNDNKEIIILTDLDKMGKKLYAKLKRGLTERGITVDNYFREFLFKHTRLRQIEGLVSYMHNFS